MKVLVVDDDIHFLDQAKKYLKKEKDDLEVETVSSAEKALDIFEENIHDAIVSDYMMPDMDGIEFLKKIRQEKESSVPIIIFTGKGREEVAMKALNLGADRYFTKVGDPKSIFGLIADAIVQEVDHRETAELLVELNSLLTSIRGIDRLIAQEDDLSDLFEKSCNLLLDTGGYLNVELALVDKDTKKLKPFVSSGKHDHWSWEITVDGKGDAPECVKKVIDNNSTVQVHGVKEYCKDCDYPEDNIDHHTVLIPMKSEEEIFGLLIICHKRDRFISNRELELLKEVVDDLSLARRRIIAEKTLREERDLFVEGPTILFKWKADEGWPVEYVTPNVESLLGYDMEEFTTGEIEFADLLPKEDKKRIKQEIQLHKKLGAKRIEHRPYRLIKKNGGLIWVKDYTNMIFSDDGELEHFMGYIVDITDQKNIEDALQKSEERYRRLFETAQNGILILNANSGDIIDVNPYMRDLLKYSLEDMYERKMWHIDPLKQIANDKNEFVALREESHSQPHVVDIRNKQGEKITIEVYKKVYQSGGERVMQLNMKEISKNKYETNPDMLQSNS